jgi:hypothetical protein
VGRPILRGAFLQPGIVLAISISMTILFERAILSELFGVRPDDPVILGSTALIAASIPAQQAASIDPMQALRSE